MLISCQSLPSGSGWSAMLSHQSSEVSAKSREIVHVILFISFLWLLNWRGLGRGRLNYRPLRHSIIEWSSFPEWDSPITCGSSSAKSWLRKRFASSLAQFFNKHHKTTQTISIMILSITAENRTFRDFLKLKSCPSLKPTVVQGRSSLLNQPSETSTFLLLRSFFQVAFPSIGYFY